jgi:DNA-binding MarR family transcriptional regulator
MDERAPLALLLLRAFRWFDDGLRSLMAGSGGPEITPAQSLVMANLDAEGTPIGVLAARMGVTRQAVQQLVAGLQSAGLVAIVPDADDRRVRLVRLTPEGVSNVRTALAIFEGLEQELSSRIGKAPAKALRKALEADWESPPSGRP